MIQDKCQTGRHHFLDFWYVTSTWNKLSQKLPFLSRAGFLLGLALGLAALARSVELPTRDLLGDALGVIAARNMPLPLRFEGPDVNCL